MNKTWEITHDVTHLLFLRKTLQIVKYETDVFSYNRVPHTMGTQGISIHFDSLKTQRS